MAENRYELNKQLAQMLKGGVIMDVTPRSRRRSRRRQARVRLWRWSGFRRISGQRAVCPV